MNGKTLKIIIGLVLLALLYAGYTLFQSKTNVGGIDNRAITDEVFLNDRAKTEEGLQYQVEQNKMIDAQDGMENELAGTGDEVSVLASASFNRLDPIHFANGGVELIESGDDIFVIFSEDFRSARGPDLFVVLAEGTKYDEATSINLGPLTNLSGRQVYKISREERESTNGSIIIRCRAFDVLFSVAEFE